MSACDILQLVNIIMYMRLREMCRLCYTTFNFLTGSRITVSNDIAIQQIITFIYVDYRIKL